MAKKTFEQYKGEQVNQIPAGYVEGMGAMGKAYESIGKSIGSMIGNIGTMMGQYQDIKDKGVAQASGTVDPTIDQVNDLVKGGILEKDANGQVFIPDKSKGLLSVDANKAIETYNQFGGKKAGEADFKIVSSYLARRGAEAEEAKAAREERKLSLEERAAGIKEKTLESEAASRAERDKDREIGRENEDRKIRLDLYKLASDTVNSAIQRHSSERLMEIRARGSIDNQREAERTREISTLKAEAEDLKRDVSRNPRISPVLAPKPSGSETSAAPTDGWPDVYAVSRTEAEGGVSATPSASTEQAEATPTPSVAPQTPSTGAPSVIPAPAAAPVQPIGAHIWKPEGSSTYILGKPNRPGAFIKRSEDSARGNVYLANVATTNEVDSAGINPNEDVGIVMGPNNEPVIIVNEKVADMAVAEAKINDITGAISLIRRGKISSFSPTAEQLSLIAGYPIPKGLTGPDLINWQRGLVASLVAQGKIKEAPGQSAGFLAQNYDTAPRSWGDVDYNTGRIPAQEVAVTPLPPGRLAAANAPSSLNVSINGKPIGISAELPSATFMRSVLATGVALDNIPEALKWDLEKADQQTRFANDTVYRLAEVAAADAKRASDLATADVARLSAATEASKLGERTGEVLRRYPGAIQETNRFGGFIVPLPTSSFSKKRMTPDYIDSVTQRAQSDDPAEARQGRREMAIMMSDLNRAGIDDKLAQNASENVDMFDTTISALTSIRITLDKQVKDGLLVTTLNKLKIGPDIALAQEEKVHQLFLLGSLREPIVGPGNPAIYEQEIVKSAIPSVDTLFSLASIEKAKVRTLALVTASQYINKQVANGFEVTPAVVDRLNKQLRGAFGDNYVPIEYTDLVGPGSWNSVRQNPKDAREWLQRRGMYAPPPGGGR